MDILYQDKRILVAIKPSGVLSTDEEGGMPQLLREVLGDSNACVRTVHRLDAAVSRFESGSLKKNIWRWSTASLPQKANWRIFWPVTSSGVSPM